MGIEARSCLPDSAVVSELVFFFSYHIYGPLLHAATFTITTIVLGLLHNKLKDLTLIQKIVFNTVLVLASLILEELLYRASIAVFLHHDAKWASVIEPFQSLVNIILLIGFTVVLTYLVLDKDKKLKQIKRNLLLQEIFLWEQKTSCKRRSY